MARYLKSDNEITRLTTHRPLEVTKALSEAGHDPMETSRYTRYLSLNSDNEGALLDIYHPLEEANFDERVGWSKPGAEELFTHTPAEADYAVSNESMRHTFPKLYAMAMRDFRQVVPSSDRSDRSERLVNKGRQMAVVHDAERTHTNYMPYQRYPIGDGQNLYSHMEGWQEVPKEEVKGATDLLRQELGYSKKLSPQFDALQKFEESRGQTYDPSMDPNSMKFPGMD
jgi:hypothetical protein